MLMWFIITKTSYHPAHKIQKLSINFCLLEGKAYRRKITNILRPDKT